MNYLFLINPVAGRSDPSSTLIPRIRLAAQNAGIAAEQLRIETTQFRGHAEQLALQAAESGAEVRIYAVGGDGTFNEALRGAIGHDNAAVGLLPFGSGNDFLRSFGVKAEFLDLDAQLRAGVKKIDLIRTQNGYAASICSAGLDAQIAYGIPDFRRIPFCGGEMSYRLSILRELLKKKGRLLQFTVDGRVFTENCLMVAVCNGRAYGGGFMAAPEALLDDGMLEVLAVRKIGLVQIAKVLGRYQRGEHFHNGAIVPDLAPIILYYRGRDVEIRPVDDARPIIINVDGECGPAQELKASLVPLAVQILLPAPVFARQQTIAGMA